MNVDILEIDNAEISMEQADTVTHSPEVTVPEASSVTKGVGGSNLEMYFSAGKP